MTTVARRPAARRPARRRRKYPGYKLDRRLTFGTGLAAPTAGWLYLGEPYHWAGLALMAVAGTITVPVALLWVLFFLPAIVMGGPFRSWRIAHRRRHGREHCKSAVITARLERIIWAADRGRCLACGITQAELDLLPKRIGKDGREYRRCLHVDHDKPWIAGFRTTVANLGLLCDEHNEIKSCWYRERNGYIWYHAGTRTPERELMAERITMIARRRKQDPFRLLRIAWAMG